MARHRIIFFLVVLLICFGLVMIGSASVVDASRDFGDKWYYLKQQGIWTVFGFFIFLFASRFPHHKLEKHARAFFWISAGLLIAVLIPGIGTKLLGARRWIYFGPINFQPAEFSKFAISVYLAGLLHKSSKLIHFLIPVGLICGLILLEPDLGTALVIGGASVISYFTITGKIYRIFIFIPVVLLALGFIIHFSPYRAARLQTFLNYSQDPLGASYHIRQALIAIGSGGISGVGLGQSRQKYEFLPEVTTDSIFAVISEELGLIGGVILIVIYFVLITYGLQIAANAKGTFSQNLALMITCLVAVQSFLNISAIIALLPLTGIPLTFISYGKSSLVMILLLMGILVNIGRSENYA